MKPGKYRSQPSHVGVCRRRTPSSPALPKQSLVAVHRRLNAVVNDNFRKKSRFYIVHDRICSRLSLIDDCKHGEIATGRCMPPRVVARACKSTVVTNNLQSAFGTQQVARLRKKCAGAHRRSLPEVDLGPLRASFETPTSRNRRHLCLYPAAWRFTPRKWTVEKEAQLQRTAQRTGAGLTAFSRRSVGRSVGDCAKTFPPHLSSV